MTAWSQSNTIRATKETSWARQSGLDLKPSYTLCFSLMELCTCKAIHDSVLMKTTNLFKFILAMKILTNCLYNLEQRTTEVREILLMEPKPPPALWIFKPECTIWKGSNSGMHACLCCCCWFLSEDTEPISNIEQRHSFWREFLLHFSPTHQSAKFSLDTHRHTADNTITIGHKKCSATTQKLFYA